ncbi:hypothetical protein HYO62_09150 [Aerococcaceae bacterium DSM 111022]|nr:hypothetical protein [Aerococcaceae bacterium DSM 111022]
MPILEVGAIASAIMAIYATMSKTVSLITTIGDLIQRIDMVYEESEENKVIRRELEEQTAKHERHLSRIDLALEDIKGTLKEVLELANSSIY